MRLSQLYTTLFANPTHLGESFPGSLEALAQIVRKHWHTAALFLKFFTASRCNSSRLSNIEVHGRN
jgi:hypothetical protein